MNEFSTLLDGEVTEGLDEILSRAERNLHTKVVGQVETSDRGDEVLVLYVPRSGESVKAWHVRAKGAGVLAKHVGLSGSSVRIETEYVQDDDEGDDAQVFWPLSELEYEGDDADDAEFALV